MSDCFKSIFSAVSSFPLVLALLEGLGIIFCYSVRPDKFHCRFAFELHGRFLKIGRWRHFGGLYGTVGPSTLCVFVSTCLSLCSFWNPLELTGWSIFWGLNPFIWMYWMQVQGDPRIGILVQPSACKRKKLRQLNLNSVQKGRPCSDILVLVVAVYVSYNTLWYILHIIYLYLYMYKLYQVWRQETRPWLSNCSFHSFDFRIMSPFLSFAVAESTHYAQWSNSSQNRFATLIISVLLIATVPFWNHVQPCATLLRSTYLVGGKDWQRLLVEIDCSLAGSDDPRRAAFAQLWSEHAASCFSPRLADMIISEFHWFWNFYAESQRHSYWYQWTHWRSTISIDI